MLCRIPTAHWLDRLHARANPTPPLPTSSPPPPPPAPAPSAPAPPPTPFSALPTILSDVFAVGPAAELPPAPVRPRKQHRPRKKQRPEQTQRPQARPAASKKEASPSGKLKRKRKVKVVDSGSVDGSGGKTEATVIDTSTKGWKSAKLIFRKDGVWKVKDKKGPGALVQSNRRRLGGKIALERLREKQKEEEKKNEEDEVRGIG